MKISTLAIGPGHPCALIAEIGNAHGGSIDRAIRLLTAAKACGASAAKLQTYTVDELIALRGDGPAPAQWGEQGYTMRTLYEKAQTPLHWIPHLFKHAARIGLPLFSSVFGPDSLAVLESCGCPAYKIARLDAHSMALFDTVWPAVGGYRKPLIVSIGPNDTGRFAANATLSLWCPEGYPQAEFSFRGKFSEQFVEGTYGDDSYLAPAPFGGFSYHGTDPLPCIIAAALGAQMIEAHFMLDAEPSELEANVSLGERAFTQMVADVRATEVLLG